MPGLERHFAEYGVAMVAMLVDGILAIGVVRPDRVGKEFQLIALRPAWNLAGQLTMLADHFLKKHHACLAVSETIAYVFQGEAALAG